jgi:Ca-activated chloride channel family protein
MRRLMIATLAVLVLTVPGRGQEPAPLVQILNPEPGAVVNGETTLTAGVDPPAAAAGVVFFVDGHETCEVAAPPFECQWDAGPDVVEHQIRLVVTLTSGGRIVRTLRTKGLLFDEKVDVDAVQVTVTVTDSSGRFVAGIPRSAFHIFEDGKQQTVSHFTSENVPLELITAVDISGSMTPSMTKLKRAVKEFLGAVPSRHQVTLLGFNDAIFALTRRTTDPNERVRAVDRLQPWGATALYDVLLRGTDMLGRQIGRKAVVVFTDGEDQGSHVALGDVERRLQTSDVTLYIIGQGRGVSQEYLRKVMVQLTSPTGGRSFFTESIDELQNAFDELLDELSNQYLVGYQPSNIKRDDKWREIKIVVDGYTNVRARQGYRVVATR